MSKSFFKMGKKALLRPRIAQVNRSSNGNVYGSIICLGKNSKTLHTERFDTFIGHPDQTAYPIGTDYSQACRNLLQYYWTPESTSLQRISDVAVQIGPPAITQEQLLQQASLPTTETEQLHLPELVPDDFEPFNQPSFNSTIPGPQTQSSDLAIPSEQNPFSDIPKSDNDDNISNDFDFDYSWF